jgi:hypothetical protein
VVKASASPRPPTPSSPPREWPTPTPTAPTPSAIDRVTALLGRDRPLAEVADTEIGAALNEL